MINFSYSLINIYIYSGITQETLQILANGVFDSTLTSTALLLKAEKTQKKSFFLPIVTNSNLKEIGYMGEKEKMKKMINGGRNKQYDESDIYWSTRPQSGVNWSDLFTDEDKFGFQILKNEGITDFLVFQYLRFSRDWGNEIAKEKINQIISIGRKQNDKNKNKNKINNKNINNNNHNDNINMKIYELEKLSRILYENSKLEMDSLIKGIKGEFILPAPGGDIIRDGIDILPTGRNIHALDPYRIPSLTAMERGRKAVQLIIESHRKKGSIIVINNLNDNLNNNLNNNSNNNLNDNRKQLNNNVPTESLFDNQNQNQNQNDDDNDNNNIVLKKKNLVLGPYPQTVAVTLWGLDTIKTKGESVAILLALVGAEPLREATGRIVGFEIVPLSVLGRPRIDVLASMSGIFRDSFGNVLDLLDDLFERISLLNESIDMNYIKKHTDELREKGVDRPFSRLFSNPPGDFGSMVNEQIGTGEWTDGKELGSTWEGRNSFSYGRKTSSVGKQSSSFESKSDSGSKSDNVNTIDNRVGNEEEKGERGRGGEREREGGELSGMKPIKKLLNGMEKRESKEQAEGGKYRPEVLSALLSSTDRIVQEIDSVE